MVVHPSVLHMRCSSSQYLVSVRDRVRGRGRGRGRYD